MDSSRRAVESYWRSRMIDGVTSDEDKVAPVYKLEEVCDLLRSSHVSIVKEVSEFIFKRLDHKSPMVKQKALRLIKYSVGKSGVEFKREMQRHSAAIRQLFHYKGQLDPLKGDALNKAVRDTAHEAISAIFASDDNKPAAPTEDINRRIQGFGNTNFDMQTEDKKSFLSEVVGLGSASIRQGLSTITSAHSLRKNDNGSYRSPNLRKSLTIETDSPDRHEREEPARGSWGAAGGSKNVAAGPWTQDSGVSMPETTSGDTGPSHTGGKSREERLLETIVTSGGMRLQPTRDALQVFLAEVSRMDPLALSHALESKLQSPLWQVRMKAVCVLESILRKKDDAPFDTIASYFNESRDSVVKCSESPQGSLREKANKVLGLLDGEHNTGSSFVGKPSTVKAEVVTVQMPDLIDTGDLDDYGTEDSTQKQIDPSVANVTTSAAPVVHDLLGDSLIPGLSTSENENEDPFADVSFHTNGDRERVDDLFSGLTVDDKQSANELNAPMNKVGAEVFDIFSSNSQQLPQDSSMHKKDVNDLMDGLSINAFASEQNQQGAFGSGTSSDPTFVDPGSQPSHPVLNKALNDLLGSQSVGVSLSHSQLGSSFPTVPMQYNIPPNFMYNPAFASQPINYSAMGNLYAQQQLLAAMSNFQHLGNLSTQVNIGLGQATGNGMEGGYTSALPDVFHPTNNQIQSHSVTTNSSKKEETKAFDFISDHISAARDPKKVI
ncbi:protein MODIFIED TRANSPORT TO THE VACUOLE 1 [Magnolia sinica]|uniref:protein MODIFIED TRANSPORT TO THE VACUOLE 1 n=1 Tax=Magnolia sinica TaxID=86752 RepID=UPI0026597BB3|nr:protein MODIFIED TRANSPORT TO THE VACUOLE 1 [Magnolia sinica]